MLLRSNRHAIFAIACLLLAGCPSSDDDDAADADGGSQEGVAAEGGGGEGGESGNGGDSGKSGAGQGGESGKSAAGEGGASGGGGAAGKGSGGAGDAGEGGASGNGGTGGSSGGSLDCPALLEKFKAAAKTLGCNPINEANYAKDCEPRFGATSPCLDEEIAVAECMMPLDESFQCDSEGEISSKDGMCPEQRAARDECYIAIAGEGDLSCKTLAMQIDEAAETLGCKADPEFLANCVQLYVTDQCVQQWEAAITCLMPFEDKFHCDVEDENKLKPAGDDCSDQLGAYSACRGD